MTSVASISSEIRMAPSWAVNRQPLWVEGQRAGDGREFAGVHQRGDDADGRAEAEQLQEVVTLDTDHDADDDAEDQRDTGGTTADHQRSVAPGDVGQQPGELPCGSSSGRSGPRDGADGEVEDVPELHDRAGDLGPEPLRG